MARTVITLFGTGKNGHHDGPGRSASFYEPSGLSIAGEKLFIADTNNNAIRVADLATQEVITLRIEENVRIWEQDSPHDLRKITSRLRRRILLGSCSSSD